MIALNMKNEIIDRGYGLSSKIPHLVREPVATDGIIVADREKNKRPQISQIQIS